MPHRTTDRGAQCPPALALWLSLLSLLSPLSVRAATTLTLDEAYRRAILRSPEIDLLQHRIVEAEVNIDRAWAILQPQLSASYTFTHLGPPPEPLSFPDLNREDIRVNCSRDTFDIEACLSAFGDAFNNPVTLDLAGGDTHLISGRVIWSPLNGRALPTIANAYDSAEAERERTDAQRQQLLLGVARAYYAAAAARGAIDAAARASARAIEQADLIRARAELGDRPDTVVKSAEIAERTAVLDLARARNAQAQALLALWSLTRSDDRPDVAEPPVPEVPEGDLAALLAQARTLRKDLAAAEKTVVIAGRAKDEVWWRFAPVVGMFGGYRYSNVEGLTGQNSQWSVGVTASVDIYDGLRYADLQAADARIATAIVTRRSVEERVTIDVERAMLAVEGANLSMSRAEEAQLLATQTLDITKAQFEVGAIRAVELTEANDRVLDAEFALIRARMDRAISVLELQYAVGLFDPKP